MKAHKPQPQPQGLSLPLDSLGLLSLFVEYCVQYCSQPIAWSIPPPFLPHLLACHLSTLQVYLVLWVMLALAFVAKNKCIGIRDKVTEIRPSPACCFNGPHNILRWQCPSTSGLLGLVGQVVCMASGGLGSKSK